MDLFFPVHEFYDVVAERVVPRPDARGQSIPVITPEDIVVFKALFDRPKDWIDIEAVLLVQAAEFDVGYVERWLAEMLGPDDSRISRLRQLHADSQRRRD